MNLDNNNFYFNNISKIKKFRRVLIFISIFCVFISGCWYGKCETIGWTRCRNISEKKLELLSLADSTQIDRYQQEEIIDSMFFSLESPRENGPNCESPDSLALLDRIKISHYLKTDTLKKIAETGIFRSNTGQILVAYTNRDFQVNDTLSVNITKKNLNASIINYNYKLNSKKINIDFSVNVERVNEFVADGEICPTL